VGSGLARNTDCCEVRSYGPLLAGSEIDCWRVQSSVVC
jgi:hypothetical protein